MLEHLILVITWYQCNCCICPHPQLPSAGTGHGWDALPELCKEPSSGAVVGWLGQDEKSKEGYRSGLRETMVMNGGSLLALWSVTGSQNLAFMQQVDFTHLKRGLEVKKTVLSWVEDGKLPLDCSKQQNQNNMEEVWHLSSTAEKVCETCQRSAAIQVCGMEEERELHQEVLCCSLVTTETQPLGHDSEG